MHKKCYVTTKEWNKLYILQIPFFEIYHLSLDVLNLIFVLLKVCKPFSTFYLNSVFKPWTPDQINNNVVKIYDICFLWGSS